jgi:hypothetical protein
MWKLKEPSDENETEYHEIEPNPSKDAILILYLKEVLRDSQGLELLSKIYYLCVKYHN